MVSYIILYKTIIYIQRYVHSDSFNNSKLKLPEKAARLGGLGRFVQLIYNSSMMSNYCEHLYTNKIGLL